MFESKFLSKGIIHFIGIGGIGMSGIAELMQNQGYVVQGSDISSNNVKVVFNTTHGPYPRGIFSNISIQLNPDYNNSISRNDLINIYHKYYGKGATKEYFVRIVDYLKPGLINEKVYKHRITWYRSIK